MENPKLGQLIERASQRDAIHMAIAPVIAAERLSPGQHIGFRGEEVGSVKEPIGIVDPFLNGPVFKGEHFWMFLYPGTITSLRHDWTHPAFTPHGTSEAWLRTFAVEKAGITYERLMDGATDYLKNGEYLSDGGRWEGFDFPGDFWNHYEAVTGANIPATDRGSFFSCSC